jgi:hypothetical protein
MRDGAIPIIGLESPDFQPMWTCSVEDEIAIPIFTMRESTNVFLCRPTIIINTQLLGSNAAYKTYPSHFK